MDAFEVTSQMKGRIGLQGSQIFGIGHPGMMDYLSPVKFSNPSYARHK
jgi:hypothetical protein